ncbi:MAG: M48 family metalloprotease [Proteobacteria bacterium]|nr:M48 family metalloprotease [Pseudomonadota bacterium]
MRLWSRIAVCVLVMFSLLAEQAPAWAQQARRPNLIRDAEIEGFLRQLARPIFKAAGINPRSVRVYLIADDRINAFVAGGQRIFIHTGLLTKAKTPNEIVGVLAHESGHVAGGHLASLNSELERASAERIIGMLLGAAAMVGGAIAGSKQTTRAGSGVLMGSQGMAQRNLLSYQRAMEASADQAAIKYLSATQQSAAGMLSLFQRLANDSIAMADRMDPYMQSHPMPLDRIRSIELAARKSPYFNKKDEPGMILRHELIKAKLMGFMESPQKVYQAYPPSNDSLPARYARAIAMFRKGDLRGAIPVINTLTAELPQNPYFWELEAQAYLENGQPQLGLPAIKTAMELLPNNSLLQALNAQMLLATENPANATAAIRLLQKAIRVEADTASFQKDLARAYALKGDFGRAELATAEYSLMTGDRNNAIERAKSAQTKLAEGTPEWVRAGDILNFASRKKKN